MEWSKKEKNKKKKNEETKEHGRVRRLIIFIFFLFIFFRDSSRRYIGVKLPKTLEISTLSCGYNSLSLGMTLSVFNQGGLVLPGRSTTWGQGRLRRTTTVRAQG